MIVGKKKKKSQYMVSHPETGSDSPIGSDRDRGRDSDCPSPSVPGNCSVCLFPWVPSEIKKEINKERKFKA